MYGIDPILLKAIMCQESGGVHLNYSQNGHAYGGMQIESINFGSTIHTYNFNKNKEEDFISLKNVIMMLLKLFKVIILVKVV